MRIKAKQLYDVMYKLRSEMRTTSNDNWGDIDVDLISDPADPTKCDVLLVKASYNKEDAYGAKKRVFELTCEVVDTSENQVPVMRITETLKVAD